jgi:hypothetical protein
MTVGTSACAASETALDLNVVQPVKRTGRHVQVEAGFRKRAAKVLGYRYSLMRVMS